MLEHGEKCVNRKARRPDRGRFSQSNGDVCGPVVSAHTRSSAYRPNTHVHVEDEPPVPPRHLLPQALLASKD